MTPSPAMAIGQIAAIRPGSIPILERYCLDFCCKGGRTLAEACLSRGLDPQQILEEILAAAESAGGATTLELDWTGRSLTELIGHIVETHHAYLHENMAKVAELAETVAKVHGDRHPELIEVRNVFAKFMSEMGPHLRKEELVLFPNIARLEREGASMPLVQPIAVMEAEHDEAGRDLEILHNLTDGYLLANRLTRRNLNMRAEMIGWAAAS